MTDRLLPALLLSFALTPASVLAQEYSYAAIAKRYESTKLDAAVVKQAEMQGECMVGLKRLIFVKRDEFSPVAEWINYRTISLLEQFPPCQVLVMMQVAKDALMDEENAAGAGS